MRVTLRAINDELARRGASARLAKAAGYFYFQFGAATEWLDRTVQAATVSTLTLEQWIEEYERLKKVNREILRGGTAQRASTTRSQTPPPRRRTQPSAKKRNSKGQSGRRVE